MKEVGFCTGQLLVLYVQQEPIYTTLTNTIIVAYPLFRGEKNILSFTESAKNYPGDSFSISLNRRCSSKLRRFTRWPKSERKCWVFYPPASLKCHQNVSLTSTLSPYSLLFESCLPRLSKVMGKGELFPDPFLATK